jgi:hypothetical protein
MASGGKKRKQQTHENIEMAKRLKAIETKQDALVFAVGKLLQVALTTHKCLEQSTGKTAVEDTVPREKYLLNYMFSKTASKTGLTRPHVFVTLLCSNIYPTGVEIFAEFMERREGLEPKKVKQWWNTHRHRIVKYIFYSLSTF